MFHLVVNQRFFRQLLSSDMAHTRASQGAANERMESGDDGDEIYKHFHRKHQFFEKKKSTTTMSFAAPDIIHHFTRVCV